MAVELFLKPFYKGVLGDLKLLCTRNYNVRVTMCDGEISTRCTVVILDIGAGPKFERKLSLLRKWLDQVKKLPGCSSYSDIGIRIYKIEQRSLFS